MFYKALLAGLTVAAGTLLSTPSLADACSDRDHTGGTILGAISGGFLGGAVSNGNSAGVIGGALLGGLAGRTITRIGERYRKLYNRFLLIPNTISC